MQENKMTPSFHGQLKQDEFVYHEFFANKHDGIYVDVGAHNGVDLSNTKCFDDLGWRGFCIEPIPEQYQLLCQNRPSSINIWGAAYDYDGTVAFRVNRGYTSMLSGVEECYHPSHKQRLDHELSVHGGTTELVSVPCFSLNTILSTHNVTSIDYLSIDVEGGEQKVLHGIDFSKISIHVITIEDNYHQEEEYDALLLPHGFVKLTRIWHDVIYYHPQFKKESF